MMIIIREKISDAQRNCSPPTDRCQTPLPKPLLGTPPSYILGMTFYGVAYAFDLFR